MHTRLSALGILIAAISLLAACAGSGSSGLEPMSASPTVTPTSSVTCPPPSPGPTPIPAFLDYPTSGSFNVAINIGEIIEKGADVPGVGVSTITVSSPTGPVPLGTPTVAPSPYPMPFATPPPTFGAPYIAIPLPTLSPSTTYTVNDVYTDWADNPPLCSAQYTQFVGTFTTGQ